MRKRTNNSKDAGSSRPSGDDQKTFRRSTTKSRPAVESRFSKPSIKKSSLRIASSVESTDKPRSFRPRAFDKDGGKESFDKPAFDKPRFDRPRFDKPGISKPRSFDRDQREFRQKDDFSSNERYNREAPEKSRFDKTGDKSRAFDRPREERGYHSRKEDNPRSRPFRGDFEGPRFDKPDFEKSREFKPKTHGAFGDKTRGTKPEFKKKDETDRPANSPETNSPDDQGISRRVGKFETAPRYNLGTYEKKSASKHKDENPEMRLNRYIANAGICSRREADDLIASGTISVNGKTITEMGYKVLRTDVVKYGKKTLNPEKLVYVLINKPKDYITTTDDPEERKTVLDLIKGACQERIYPVGRLDRNTTGLLLMTNDGELAEKLTHPSGGIKKIYQAELDKPITTEDFERLQAGLELEDGFIRPDEVGIVTPDAMVVGLEIHSGRNRIVRRMFEHLGYEVQKLDRTVFAGLNKKDLPRGKWRFLTEKEVIKLKFML